MIDIDRVEGSRPFTSGLGVARPRSEPRPPSCRVRRIVPLLTSGVRGGDVPMVTVIVAGQAMNRAIATYWQAAAAQT